jgi:hypothetical protein
MKTGGRKEVKTDYIFARYPLWVRYSGLPVKLGPGPWCIFQRLLELMERFGSNKFHYSIERLGETAGVSSLYGVKKIIDRLAAEELLRYTTHHGRGKETDFELLLPLKTPISEEDVYKSHPRLRSWTYKTQIENGGPGKNPNNVVVLSEENPNNVVVLSEENPNNVVVLSEENPNNVVVLRNKVGVLAKTGVPDLPIATPKESGQKMPHEKDKKDLYKKDNNNKKDLSHDEVDPQNSVAQNQLQAESAVVVALNSETLKEYGIAGEPAVTYLKKYPPDYLLEKIEIIEYKRYCGEQIRNPGGMLKKAIEEDWQPPEGFSTRAQREEATRQEVGAKEAEARAAAEKEMRARQQKAMEEAAEAWKKNASEKELHEVHEKARLAVMAENPDTSERWLKQLIRFREDRIICEECLAEAGIPGRGG